MNRSLKANTNGNDKANDIRLSLNTPRGSKIVWVLVEGEDDGKIYPKFFDASKAKVEYVNGKTSLIEALEILTQETKQVVGIADADFLHLNKLYPRVKNLFYTDYHDIEMTMLSFEEVRNNLLTEYQMQDKQATIWQNVLEEASYIGYIRWYNDINDNKINFSGIGYGKIADLVAEKLKLQKPLLLATLNQRSPNKERILTDETVNTFIEASPTDDSMNLCSGHDAAAFLSLIIGSRTTPKGVETALRLSFNIQHFRRTKLYKQLQEWQNQNSFQIIIF